jgi:hypothetical protein
MVYSWKKDGKGLWVEVSLEPPPPPDQVIEWLITYDPARQCFVEKATKIQTEPGEMEARWDGKTRTLTFRTEGNYRQHGSCIWTGTRTLPSPDQSEVSLRVATKEGQVLEEFAGTYLRVKR